MKTLPTVLYLAVFSLLLTFTSTANASVAVSDAQTSEALQLKASEHKTSLSDILMSKIEKRMEKKIAKFQKRLAKKMADGQKVDFKTEPDKWMWFWLFGWGAGFLLYSFGWFVAAPFWYLGYLCMLAGTVCLIIWLLKKSGSM
jgi:Flp pilus assembly protein TadB